MIEQDSQILCNIKKTLDVNPNASQRTLAQNSNVSLGQMNAVLKRCAERGWIAVKNLNMKKVCYCLTAEGIKEISKRTSRYMKSSFSMMNEYAENVYKVVQKAKDDGKQKVTLLGKSNIQFVIEWACEKCGICFEEIEDYDIMSENALVFCGELVDENYIDNLNIKDVVSVMKI